MHRVYVLNECQVQLRQFMIMRWLLSFLVLAIVATVRAASFTGNRLLVVLDEQADREKYSVFLEDLAGKCFFHVLRNREASVRVGGTLEISDCVHLTVEHLLLQVASAVNLTTE